MQCNLAIASSMYGPLAIYNLVFCILNCHKELLVLPKNLEGHNPQSSCINVPFSATVDSTPTQINHLGVQLFMYDISLRSDQFRFKFISFKYSFYRLSHIFVYSNGAGPWASAGMMYEISSQGCRYNPCFRRF